MEWCGETIDFKASGSFTLLSFKGDPNTSYWGPTLDNVSMIDLTTAVPAAPTLFPPVVGNGRALLTWSSNGDGGSPITGYNLYISTTSSGEDYTSPPVCTTNASTTSCLVTGLTLGQTYYFTVTATNVNGTSPPSNEESNTLPTGGASCKHGGFLALIDANGQLYANQGACVSDFATSGVTPIGTNAE